MREFDPRAPLIFIHVPKTAGSAVRELVESWFPGRFHRHYFNETQGKVPNLLPPEAMAPSEAPPVIYGHFNKHRGFGVKDSYPQVTQFVTILRDPFEAAVSHYFYVRKVSGDWKETSRVPTESLETHIRTADLNMLNHFPDEMTLDNYPDLLEEHFVEIGITEELPRTLDAIARTLGTVFDPGQLEVVNATERDQPLPEHYRDEFREKHPLEYAVYEFAKSRVAAM